ncbi:MAG TPA: cytochrome d ubiquinol oxidase subunit II [Afifellaceae bacterium]|nr:cytochrome d ubiquinol oxidase subunit II [Afifellaceae bacterium]
MIAFSVLAYVVLDGFDLGVGMLFPFYRTKEERDVVMKTVAPIWDGNETWLVLGGGGLLDVFPMAYSLVLTALYAPLIVMLLALVFRGVAFEFRFKAQTDRGKLLWDIAVGGGSYVATFAQGIALGALVQGIEVANRAYAGGWWDWLTPFSLLTGLAVVVGYTLLGAAWLIWKTEGGLQDYAYRTARVTGGATLALIGVVSLWTPFLDPAYMQRWFAWPAILLVMPVPLLVLAAAYGLFKGIERRRDAQPFLSALALFVLSFVGLGISFYPHIVPPGLTIREAAAPDNSLAFLLAGAIVLIPVILIYTAHAYWVFRGKIGSGEGYH